MSVKFGDVVTIPTPPITTEPIDTLNDPQRSELDDIQHLLSGVLISVNTK